MPQGSTPSLPLFLLYTSNISHSPSAIEIQCYDDDIAICSSNIRTKDNCSVLQFFCKKLLQWCKLNRLKLLQRRQLPYFLGIQKRFVTGISLTKTPEYFSKVIFSSLRRNHLPRHLSSRFRLG